MRENDSSTMFAGGIIIVVIVIMACLKAIEKIFIQMGKTFDAFGKMAQSFLAMAWQSVLALGLIALGIGCVIAAGYFTYKYYLMVKRGTELKKRVDDKLQDFAGQVNSLLKDIRESTDERIEMMEIKLKEALDRPTLTPTPIEVVKVAALPEPVGTPLETDDSELAAPDQDSSPRDVSNPF
ncbi:MAG: hypothetical protein ACXWRE_07935 [Pseudobdellovibrionaceae bacterium]